MEKWKGVCEDTPVLTALLEQGFTTPTEVQKRAVPEALRGNDVIGAAETGSGKTLAFGLPIIHHLLLQQKDVTLPSSSNIDISNELTPPPPKKGKLSSRSRDVRKRRFERRLAAVRDRKKSRKLGCVYVEDDIADDAFMKIMCQDEKEVTEQNHEKVVDLDDVMLQKEKGEGLAALIITPTRELALQVKDHIAAISKHTDIKVCAVVGGMADQKQERLLKQHPRIVVATPGRLWSMIEGGNPHLSCFDQLKFLVLDEADRMVERGHFAELKDILHKINGQPLSDGCKRQKFVFSATLTLPKKKKRKGKKDGGQDTGIEELISLVGLADDASIVDLTSHQVTVNTLTEARINCTTEQKDVYLYYFLSTYPGRALVFLNTIDALRRLSSILKLLQLEIHCLHAGMQQRQRLKNLDRFMADSKSVLLATDVAARGLDIPAVEHVIHYQVPKTTELYVHRSGRTARAKREGLSVMLIGPEDVRSYRTICRTLNKDEDLPLFPVDMFHYRKVQDRVKLARTIDKEEHKSCKSKRHNDWFQSSAKAMDLILDESLYPPLVMSFLARFLMKKKVFHELYSVLIVPQEWLQEEFLPYFDKWEQSVTKRTGFEDQAKKMMITQETLHGIKVNVSSFVDLIKYVFTIPGVTVFLSERLCQDPLEKFFGCQRQRGGTNENPTVQEFCRNTQALRVVNSVCGNIKKGNCRGGKDKMQVDHSKENKPLPKRRYAHK